MFKNEEHDIENHDEEISFFVPTIPDQNEVDLKIAESLTDEIFIKILKALKLSSKIEKAELINKICAWLSLFQVDRDVEYTAEAIQKHIDFKISLLIIVKASGSALSNINNIDAIASRAITFLNAAKISFSGMDLSSIKAPNAILNDMRAHRVNFEGANLAHCTFVNAFLRVVLIKPTLCKSNLVKNLLYSGLLIV